MNALKTLSFPPFQFHFHWTFLAKVRAGKSVSFQRGKIQNLIGQFQWAGCEQTPPLGFSSIMLTRSGVYWRTDGQPKNTMDSCYNKLLGPSEITLLLSKFCYIRVAKTIIYKEIWTLGPRKLLCYVRICYISVLYNKSPLYNASGILRGWRHKNGVPWEWFWEMNLNACHQVFFLLNWKWTYYFYSTVEPRYKEVGYNKTLL